jgi:hypothetical protein
MIGLREITKYPPPFCDIVNAACAADTRWFAAHPHKCTYVREMWVGEFWTDLCPPRTQYRYIVIAHRSQNGVQYRAAVMVAANLPISDGMRLPRPTIFVADYQTATFH